MQEEWNLYGEDNFCFSVIEESTAENRLNKEQHWIDQYLVNNLLYNFKKKASLSYNRVSRRTAARIIKLLEKGTHRVEISKKFSISKQTVSDIAHGRCYPNLHRGKIRWNMWHKISDVDVDVIKSYAKNGFKQEDIANMYGVNQSTITRIINGKRRKEVRYAAV
jgi:transposase